TAVDDHAVVRSDLRVIAVGPHAGILLKVRRSVPRSAGVVQESQRHRWERPRADQLTLLPAHGPARFIEYFYRHAEPAALDFSAPDGKQRTAQDETGDDIGAAGNRRQVNAGLDFLIDMVEPFRGERTA